MPNYIYKYRHIEKDLNNDIEKLISTEKIENPTLKDILEIYPDGDDKKSLKYIDSWVSGNIRLSTFEDFNDPFERDMYFKCDGDALMNLISTYVKDSAAKSKILAYLASKKETVNLDLHYLLNNSNFKSRYGITCFSQHWNLPPMWAHYANSGFGFCLEYKTGDALVSTFKQQNLVNITPFNEGGYVGWYHFSILNYLEKTNQNITIDEQAVAFYKNFHEQEIVKTAKIGLAANPFLLTLLERIFLKSTHWQYENEYRLLYIEANHQNNNTRENNKNIYQNKVLKFFKTNTGQQFLTLDSITFGDQVSNQLKTVILNTTKRQYPSIKNYTICKKIGELMYDRH